MCKAQMPVMSGVPECLLDAVPAFVCREQVVRLMNVLHSEGWQSICDGNDDLSVFCTVAKKQHELS
jgi:hypothetical protein